jgi:transposase InsO family protein
MCKNLISVGYIADTGNLVVFSATHCWILDKFNHCNIIATSDRDPSNGLYHFDHLSQPTPIQANTAELSDTTILWYRRLGHLSFSGLNHLIKKERVTGLPTVEFTYRVYECCLAGRQHRERFPKKSETRSQQIAECIHSDLVGPMPHPLLAGSKYILVFTDDFSRKSWTYFLRSKDETYHRFRLFKEKLESETRNKFKILRIDRGGEYLSQEFKQYCAYNGIHRELTQAPTLQQNGVAEKRNRTLLERACSISADCNLPIFL